MSNIISTILKCLKLCDSLSDCYICNQVWGFCVSLVCPSNAKTSRLRSSLKASNTLMLHASTCFFTIHSSSRGRECNTVESSSSSSSSVSLSMLLRMRLAVTFLPLCFFKCSCKIIFECRDHCIFRYMGKGRKYKKNLNFNLYVHTHQFSICMHKL